MKNRSWSDEFEELILQYSGSCKDPPEEPEERKKRIIQINFIY